MGEAKAVKKRIDPKVHEQIRLFYFFGRINYMSGIQHETIRKWSSLEGWPARKKELAKEREEILQADSIKTMKEANRQQLKRLEAIHERFDKDLADGSVEITASAELQAMKTERDILRAIHGVSTEGLTTYERILAVVATTRVIAEPEPDDG